MLELGIARCTKTRGPGFPAPLACLLCRAHPIGHDSAGYDSEPLRRARRSPPWRRGLGDGSAQRDCGSETCATRVAVAEPPRGRQAQEAPAAEFPCDASTQSSPRGERGDAADRTGHRRFIRFFARAILYGGEAGTQVSRFSTVRGTGSRFSPTRSPGCRSRSGRSLPPVRSR